MARNMVQYLHFRILKFPLITWGSSGLLDAWGINIYMNINTLYQRINGGLADVALRPHPVLSLASQVHVGQEEGVWGIYGIG